MFRPYPRQKGRRCRQRPQAARPPRLAPVLRPAGWAFRRLGEKLEGWAGAGSPAGLEEPLAEHL